MGKQRKLLKKNLTQMYVFICIYIYINYEPEINDRINRGRTAIYIYNCYKQIYIIYLFIYILYIYNIFFVILIITAIYIADTHMYIYI
jgi:hypothetical protein